MKKINKNENKKVDRKKKSLKKINDKKKMN